MKKKTVLLLLAMLTALFCVSCESDLNEPTAPKNQKVVVSFEFPESTPNLEGITLLIKNKDSGREYKFEGLKSGEKKELELLTGVYDITAEVKEDEYLGYVALLSNFTVRSNQQPADIHLSFQPQALGSGFVIKEILYSGTNFKESGRPYIYASYVIINNNSNEILYADSIAFGTHAGVTARSDGGKYSKYLEQGDIVLDFLFMVPGNGKTYPIQPGKDFIICMEAKDHSQEALYAPNLAKHANFEWYEETGNPRFQLTNNPDVPNMEILYKTSRTFTPLHMSGNNSYFIAKIQKPVEEVVNRTIEIPVANPSMPPTKHVILPTAWIVDGVELSKDADDIAQKHLPISVDKSFTNTPETRKGYVIQRKVRAKAGDRNVYQDTNDSKQDFISGIHSSLL